MQIMLTLLASSGGKESQRITAKGQRNILLSIYWTHTHPHEFLKQFPFALFDTLLLFKKKNLLFAQRVQPCGLEHVGHVSSLRIGMVAYVCVSIRSHQCCNCPAKQMLLIRIKKSQTQLCLDSKRNFQKIELYSQLFINEQTDTVLARVYKNRSLLPL